MLGQSLSPTNLKTSAEVWQAIQHSGALGQKVQIWERVSEKAMTLVRFSNTPARAYPSGATLRCKTEQFLKYIAYQRTRSLSGQPQSCRVVVTHMQTDD